eukprot:snap_masked-scaffold_133-processed-gene-0.1-mRNA-1 protein AED:1.00 eAED:1.00 QI:0/0/0/0/1/1/2/0/125
MKHKSIEKKILKKTISKLPTRFEIDTDIYNQLHELVGEAYKKLLDEHHNKHLQKIEKSKTPGLELLEQLFKLKQWAMIEHAKDMKMDLVMQVRQPMDQSFQPHHKTSRYSPTPDIYSSAAFSLTR